MVLISNEEIKMIFTVAVELLKGSKVPKIHHPNQYRGCENSQVMCVGVEDSWMMESISRAIQSLFIVEGGTHPSVQSRKGLWMEMERRGLLLHHEQPTFPALASISKNNWRALHQKSPFLKVKFQVLNLNANEDYTTLSFITSTSSHENTVKTR